MFSMMQRSIIWAKVVGGALVVIAGAHAHAQTLECAAVSSGGGISSNGSILVVGQAVVGTMSSASFTIEAGIVPCLDAGGCATTADCDDGDDCTADTCDPGNPEAGGDGCVHEYQAQVYADICSPFAPDGPQPNIDDILCELDDFADGASVSGCPGGCTGAGGPQQGTTDLHPCPEDGGGDGQMILDDILNMLDAFAGLSPCDDPCP